MSYPPQQPGGDPYGRPQPDPYGQQQPQYGWPEQYGPPPQPGQQYPPTSQFAQPGGYGTPGGYGGPPPPPEKKNRTGLWVGIGIAVVAVAALAVTGFVAPGFFLSKDEPSAAAPPPSQSSAPSSRSSAPRSSTESSSPSESEQVPPSLGLPDSPANPTLKEFVAKLNAKDGAGASALACEDAAVLVEAGVQTAVAGEPQLETSPAIGEEEAVATVSGTVSGEPQIGLLTATSTGSSYCISLFTITPGEAGN
ncbi:hypothetical protein [Amycolatopsis nigrescens]|uniref:hypothetical protein n=1 Tax=Amycolatopsis nigrescens TaxID=381445 RepID=UPI000399941F|nr:hypothetical protein [Amycolatopsis nigrescens]